MDPDPLEPLDGSELADWRALPPARRRAWWTALWSATIALGERYRLALRSDWWQDPIQVEALAAFCCWLRLYDTGAETDPTGKLQLLWELERLRGILRSGEEPFNPERDREAFEQYLTSMTVGASSRSKPVNAGDDRLLRDELATLAERLRELRTREHTLSLELGDDRQKRDRRNQHAAQQELRELRQAIKQLAERHSEISKRLERTGIRC